MEAKGQSPMDEDAARMMRFASGDETAFEEIVRRHASRLLGFAERFFHNRARSEEVVQEVFLRVFEARKRYVPTARFTTWLYTIATRLCLNELRRSRPEERPLDVDGAGSGPATPAEELEAARLAGAIQRALDGLPANQRAALLLSRFADHSYAEIAAILGVSEAAVKSLLFRATDELHRIVRKEAGT